MKKFLVLFIMVLKVSINAQPYYYISTYEPFPVGHHGTGDMYRINMDNPAEVETLMTDVYDLGSTCSDEYGNWLADEEGFGFKIMNLNNPAQKKVISEDSQGIYKFSFSKSANNLLVLYDAGWAKNMILVDPKSIMISDTIKNDICWECNRDEDIILSKTGDIMYMMKTDTVLRKGYIGSYSFSSKQITKSKYLDEISEKGCDAFYFDFRRNGLATIESLFLLPTPHSYFRIYFIDKDSLSIPIYRDDKKSWFESYVAEDGKKMLLFEVLLTPDSLNLNPTGKIESYDMTNGELKKTIQLPPDGEIMCFENYPNDVWYTKNIEHPEREIYKISFDSYSDEPKVKKLFPK